MSGIFKDLQARRYLAKNRDLAETLQEVFWAPRGRTLETSDTTLRIGEMLTIVRDCEEVEGLRSRTPGLASPRFGSGVRSPPATSTWPKWCPPSGHSLNCSAIVAMSTAFRSPGEQA